MSVGEYRTYYDAYLQKLVDRYMEKKYNNGKYILCWFDLYTIKKENARRSERRSKKIDLKRDVYTNLLFLLLKHPEITFQELPRYISFNLYEDLLVHLRFPTTHHPMYPDSPHSRSLPIAVKMSTLQNDAQAIAGHNPYSFSIHSYTSEFEFEAILATIWMNKMEIDLRYTSNKNEVNSLYGMIDVEEVKEALHVKTYKGIEGALYRMWNKLPNDKSDAFWIIRWLDKHKINYIQATDVITNEKGE